MYELVIVIGPCRSVAVRISPFYTFLIVLDLTFTVENPAILHPQCKRYETCHSVVYRVIPVFNPGVLY